MSRTVSARIPAKMHDEVRYRCNLLGESINDFVAACIELGLYGSTDFDLGEETISDLENKKSEFDKNSKN